ncbi:unnamed protein product [Ilex paraguariensis]|uniref:Uncharacterized protein n=1 Tax=Ilex paraguariensis TaxID=185542 RepID=A0ABC8RS67_9AQUA
MGHSKKVAQSLVTPCRLDLKHRKLSDSSKPIDQKIDKNMVENLSKLGYLVKKASKNLEEINIINCTISRSWGLWLRLLKLGATDDPLSSFEYGTILALIESDAEGIGGSGFVECIREHIHSGWAGQLTEEQFIAVKELLKTAISRATSRNDMATVRDALEVSAEMYKKDTNNVSDFVQRHLRSLSIWEELRTGHWLRREEGQRNLEK